LKKSHRRRQSVTRPSVPQRPLEFASPDHRWKNPQEYFQKMAFFRTLKTTIQMTTKNHQLTTFSPQKPSKKHTKKHNPL
jgi:hypothetical protein